MRNLRTAIGAALVASATVLAPAMITGTAHAAATVGTHHRCTKTSTGKCIRGGEFCPQRDYHHIGYSASGRRYVCKGNRTHPHWELP